MKLDTLSTEELVAEYRDAEEQYAHHRLAAAAAARACSDQIGRTIAVYGNDETRWPGDSLHAVRSLRAQLGAIEGRATATQSYITDLAAELRRRG